MWESYRGPDFNPLHDFTYEESYDSDVPFEYRLTSMIKKDYEYDLLKGTGPYLAVVLKVLTGPQSTILDSKELKYTSDLFGD